ncbi:unnamed protein product [Somion occarium]|uniref:Uncharacterized protein n=1 Tax=Somion occarium TaxID=3059160 RepID=A0ABP1E9L9_9APHY
MNCPGRRKLTTSSTGSVLLPLMTRTFLLPTKNCKLPEPYLSIDFINGYCLWTESFEIFETPEWVLFWLKRSHLVFLVLAIACFSVGLVLFVILLVSII